jgi:hypothetical protein
VTTLGARRLFALVTMLPYDSALAAVLRKREEGDDKAVPLERVHRREKRVGTWAEFAKVLKTSPALKKGGE